MELGWALASVAQASVECMAIVESVNIGRKRPFPVKNGQSGIDKRPSAEPVLVRAPSPGLSGVTGDHIGDPAVHGGEEQAVYAYAREDLDRFGAELDTTLPSGKFGENLTTNGLDVTGALIGERWRIGDDVVLQVTSPRTPCRTFAVWLGVQGWVKIFTEHALPGAYLRVIEPGLVGPGDPVVVESTPDHDVTIGDVFRALTLEPDLLPRLLKVDELPEHIKDTARRRLDVG